MIAIIAPGADSFGEFPQVEVHRPVTVKQIAGRLGKKPFGVIADLMALNCFATISGELSDAILAPLGARYQVTFRIVADAGADSAS